MAQRVSIPAGKADPTHRYMRDLLTTTHLEAQGGLTELTNIATVARQLHTDRAALLDFFKRRLGVPIVRTAAGSALRDEFDRATLERVLEKYIALHVLCTTCGLPEVDTRKVGQSGAVRGVCAACGGRPAVATS